MRQQGGFVLLVVLVAVLLIISISAVAIHQSLNDARLAFATGKTNTLFVMADAPLARFKNSPLTKKQAILDKLIEHHKTLSADNKMTLAHLCYDKTLGMDNFVPSRMQIAPNQLDCPKDKVRLWLSLWIDDADMDDFGQLVSGVALDEVAALNEIDWSNYHLRLTALAAEQALDGDCAREPLYAKSCLDDAGVAYQMLVQEFYYGYQ